MKEFTIDGRTWTFNTAANGTVEAHWTNGTESDTVWTAETERLPETMEEAMDMLESLTWETR